MKIIKKAKIFLFILLIIIIFIPLGFSEECQRGSYFIRNYTPEEYRGFPQVWAVIQDKRGIMYFGSSDGIIEFDGIKWDIIKIRDNKTIRDLEIDSNGIIYVGAIGDFGYLSFTESGKTIYKSLVPLLKNSNRNINNIFEIHTLSSGVYFIEENKIFRYYNNKIEIIPVSLRSKGTVINDMIFAQDDSGLKVIFANKILSLPQTEIFNRKKAGRVLILPYDSGRVLILSDRIGSFIYDISYVKKIKKISFPVIKTKRILHRFYTDIDAYIKKHGIYTGKRLTNNLYAIAPFEGGLIIMNKKGKIINFIDESSGLQNNIVFDIFVDKSNNIWVTLNNGISFIETGSPITFFGSKKGLKNLVLDIIKYKDKIFVSSMDGLHYLPECKNYDMFSGKGFKSVKGKKYSFFTLLNYNNILLVGGYEGIYYLNKNNELERLKETKFVYVLKKSEKFPDKIFVGKRGGLSIIFLQKKSGDKIRISEFKIKEIKGIVRRIENDRNGDIWVSTQNNGLFYIRFNKNNIFDYKIYKIKPVMGLPESYSAFAYFVNGEIIILSSKYFYKAILPENKGPNTIPSPPKIIKIKKFDKLIPDSSNISLLRGDDEKNIIVGMINKFEVLKEEEDGKLKLIDKPFAKISGYVTSFLKDKEVEWIGTSKGLYEFDTTYNKDYNKHYNALIRKVVINNKKECFFGNYYEVKNGYKVASLKQPSFIIPTLNYSENSLYFEFSSTFYEHSKYNRYSYKLEGYEKKWSNWVSFTKKEYTNLPPGNYVFKVRAKNIFGVISKEAKFKFKVLPPLYMTWYAYVFYFVLAGFFIYLILLFSNKRHLKAKERLEKIIRERTAEIERQKKKLEELATHDGLTGVYNKRKFNEVFNHEWKRAERNGMYLGILMVDVDFFKQYNDTYGHQAGDKALRKVAQAIKSMAKRPADFVARYGGEEFIVLLPETDPEGVKMVGEKIRRAVENLKIPHEKSTVSEYLTVSVGAISIIPKKDLFFSLIKAADEALYESKKKGRNRVSYKDEL